MSATTTKFRSDPDKSTCPVTFGFNHKGKIKPVYCKRWTCPDCARRNARRWAARVKTNVNKSMNEHGQSWWMLTLTMGSKYRNPADAYRDIPKLWARLRQFCRRENDGVWIYVAFIEGQENRRSMPHFHILTPALPKGCYGKRGRVTEHATHDFAHAFGWGYEAKAEPVTSNGAAYYVSKYVSKGSGTVPKGFRRVRVSAEIEPLSLDPGHSLIVRRHDETYAEFIDRAATVTGLDHKTLSDRWLANEAGVEEENQDEAK